LYFFILAKTIQSAIKAHSNFNTPPASELQSHSDSSMEKVAGTISLRRSHADFNLKGDSNEDKTSVDSYGYNCDHNAHINSNQNVSKTAYEESDITEADKSETCTSKTKKRVKKPTKEKVKKPTKKQLKEAEKKLKNEKPKKV
jgi:hypothetical protein